MEREPLYLQNKKRLIWLSRHNPEKIVDTLAWLLNALPWVNPESPTSNGEAVVLEQRSLATWFDTLEVPNRGLNRYIEKTIPIKVEPMSKKNELKSEALIEQHKLRETITLDEKGLYTLPEDLYEVAVLAECGISVEQERKRQRLSSELLPAVTLVSGEKAVEHFKANPEATEVGFNYKMGPYVTASAVHTRDANPRHTLVQVETKVTGAEMNRVLSHLDSLFGDINT